MRLLLRGKVDGALQPAVKLEAALQELVVLRISATSNSSETTRNSSNYVKLFSRVLKCWSQFFSKSVAETLLSPS